MKVDELFNPKLLERHIEQGLVRAQRHPTQPLTVHCYTQRTQHTRAWDDVTRTCRGLIVADDGTVVARPFPKFFNLGEHGDDGPAGPIDLAPPVTAYDKADGSLGIGYLDAEGSFRWATKGSFAGKQAAFANDLFGERVPLCDQLPFDLDPAEHTILAEIIYPENRIVVDYGRLAELRLLGAIEIATGNFTPPHDPVFNWWPWARVEALGILGGPHDLPSLPSRPNSEGYVLVSADGVTRAKAKEAEYVRLHALLTGCTSRTVWDYLRTDTGMDRLYDTVPDEFRRWLNDQIRSIRNKKWEVMRGAFKAYRAILQEMGAPAPEIRDDSAMRKQFAMLATASPHRPFLFMLLDGNTTKFKAACWAAARPELELPFTGDPDDAP